MMRATRACTRVLGRASDEQELLSRLCEVMVDTGGYRMAWVGLKENDQACTVRPVAVAGYEAGYLETIAITWADSERGRGPTGTACREGRVAIVRDVDEEPRFAPWRLSARKRGYRSLIAVPIAVRGDVVGAMTVYAAELDAFDDEEAQFLRELAEDLGFGIAARRDRAERSRMERVLAESEGQLNAVFEQSPIGMALVRTDGVIVRANESLASMLGYLVEELVGISPRQLIHPDDPPVPESLDSMLSGGLLELEQHFLRRDGKAIWFNIRAFPLRDRSGNVTNVMVHVRDVSDRKATEQALRDSEERFRTLIETATDPMFLVDLEGRFLLVNREVVRGLNTEQAQMIGTRGEHVFPAEAVERQMEMVRKTIDMDATVETNMCLPTSSGPRWYSTRLSPVHGPDGKPRMVLGIARDMTAQRQAAEALRAANETLTGILNASPLAVVAVDRAMDVTLWKGAAPRIFGWTEEEVLGRPLPIVPPSDWSSTKEQLDLAVGGKRISNKEMQRLRKDGKLISVALSTAPLRDQDGNVTGALAMFVDLTESKRLEAQLQHAVKMEAIGRLAGGVAHDFNNLIMVVLANAGLLASELSPDHPLHQNVEEIRTATERTAALTKQLLAFSRRQIMQHRVLNVNTVVGDTERLLRRIMGEDIEMTLRLDPKLGAVLADPDQLSQVLLNLAVNARDAMPRGGRLTIETTNIAIDASYAAQHVDVQPGPYVKLVISDNGTGMPPEVREHLFEPFFTTKERGRGTGLGLSTVYGIVRQSSGHISVYSEPGRGSTFTIYLPRHDEEPPSQAARIPTVRPRGKGERILLVEDEAGVRGVVQRALERNNYLVTVASGPDEALRMLPELGGPLPLVITDLVMPGMSGGEMAALIQAEWPDVRVLFMSGYTESAAADQGLPSVKSAFLQKPFGLDSLLVKVRDVLDEDLART